MLRLCLSTAAAVCFARCAFAGAPASLPADRPVVILSMDGLSYDYLARDAAQHPNFAALKASGVHASQGMSPTFISKTFPSHYTMATGLHPESHGILGNTMYDPDLQQQFHLRDIYNSTAWFLGEPIWVTAERQGVRSAVYFWPGSEAVVGGVRPSTFMRYNQSVPFSARVAKVAEWLAMPEGDPEKPSLVMAYMHQPDQAGHFFGPDSPQVRDSVAHMDAVLGDLLKAVRASSANLLVVSDHGMAAAGDSRVIYLEEQLGAALLGDLTLGQVSPFFCAFAPSEAVADLAVAQLRQAGLEAMKREDIPEGWHVKRSRRVGDVVAIAPPGWSIRVSRSDPPCCDVSSGNTTCCGDHGYPGDAYAMRAVFYATGPAFRNGTAIPEVFPNTDIYPLLCHLLRLQPAPNNGTLAPFGPALRRSPHRSHWTATRDGSKSRWVPSQRDLTLYPAAQEVFPGQRFDISVVVPRGLPGADAMSVSFSFAQAASGGSVARTAGASDLCDSGSVEQVASELHVTHILRGCSVGRSTTLTAVSGVRSASVRWRAQPARLGNGAGAKNAVLFVGDGMSLPMLTAARLLLRNNPEHRNRLVTDTFHAAGTCYTHSLESIVTDSAAAASALNTGHKTVNGATGCYPDATTATHGFDTDNPRVETLAEYLRRMDSAFRIGVVTTASVVDATPAGVWGHCSNRTRGTTLAEQALDLLPEVIMGGGRAVFEGRQWEREGLPADPQLLRRFASAGYTVAGTEAEMRAAANSSATTRLLGLFADKHMLTEADRQRQNASERTEPALHSMVASAVQKLAVGGERFFLMVEAASIDKQAHACDYTRMLGETLELQNTIQTVKDTLEGLGLLDDTLMVVTSDHATGGYDVYGTVDTDAAQPQDYNSHISMYGHSEWQDWEASPADGFLVRNWESAQFTFAGMNVNHPSYVENFRSKQGRPVWWLMRESDLEELRRGGGIGLADNLGGEEHIEAKKASVHTASDVMVYAHGPGASLFRPGQNNTDVFLNMLQALMPGACCPQPGSQTSGAEHQLALLQAENQRLREALESQPGGSAGGGGGTAHPAVATGLVLGYAALSTAIAAYIFVLYRRLSARRPPGPPHVEVQELE